MAPAIDWPTAPSRRVRRPAALLLGDWAAAVDHFQHPAQRGVGETCCLAHRRRHSRAPVARRRLECRCGTCVLRRRSAVGEGGRHCRTSRAGGSQSTTGDRKRVWSDELELVNIALSREFRKARKSWPAGEWQTTVTIIAQSPRPRTRAAQGRRDLTVCGILDRSTNSQGITRGDATWPGCPLRTRRSISWRTPRPRFMSAHCRSCVSRGPG